MSRFQRLVLIMLGTILLAVVALIGLVVTRPQNATAQILGTRVNAPLEFHGNNAVILGPLALDDGIYIATGTFSALASIKVVSVSGDCEGNGANGFLFLNVDDYSKTPKQATVTAKGCTALFQVTAGADWQFELKPLVS